MNDPELRYKRRDLRGRDLRGRYLAGPPLPAWWARPAKHILLDATAQHPTAGPWHMAGLGAAKLVLHITTRWS